MLIGPCVLLQLGGVESAGWVCMAVGLILRPKQSLHDRAPAEARITVASLNRSQVQGCSPPLPPGPALSPLIRGGVHKTQNKTLAF